MSSYKKITKEEIEELKEKNDDLLNDLEELERIKEEIYKYNTQVNILKNKKEEIDYKYKDSYGTSKEVGLCFILI